MPDIPKNMTPPWTYTYVYCISFTWSYLFSPSPFFTVTVLASWIILDFPDHYDDFTICAYTYLILLSLSEAQRYSGLRFVYYVYMYNSDRQVM